MDHIEQDQQFAAELRALATEVGAILGYTVQPAAEGAYYRDAVRLHGPHSVALAITRQWNNPQRLHIHGAYPHTAGDLTYRRANHDITVAISRGPTAIACDIQRRLLPGYLTDLAATLDAIRQREAAEQARETIADELLAAVPGLRRGIESDSRITLVHHGGDPDRGAGVYGSVEIHGCGDTVSVTLTGAADTLLPAFTAALTTRSTTT